MKYYTKIAWILDRDDFMDYSKKVEDKIKKHEEKKGEKITSKATWNIVNNQIRKKVKNPLSEVGVCSCKSGYLCEHRKKYLKTVMETKER